jgi:hypothetical protein
MITTMEDAAMDNVQKMLDELQGIRNLVESPDDSWMDTMSEEELKQLRERALLLAENLSKIQDELRQGMTPEP